MCARVFVSLHEHVCVCVHGVVHMFPCVFVCACSFGRMCQHKHVLRNISGKEHATVLEEMISSRYFPLYAFLRFQVFNDKNVLLLQPEQMTVSGHAAPQH